MRRKREKRTDLRKQSWLPRRGWGCQLDARNRGHRRCVVLGDKLIRGGAATDDDKEVVGEVLAGGVPVAEEGAGGVPCVGEDDIGGNVEEEEFETTTILELSLGDAPLPHGRRHIWSFEILGRALVFLFLFILLLFIITIILVNIIIIVYYLVLFVFVSGPFSERVSLGLIILYIY